jgi:hypothetical protein
MAGSTDLGPLGTEHHEGKVPEALKCRSFAFPGPIGTDLWTRAARADLKSLLPQTAQQSAEAIVREFGDRPGGGVFSKISRARVERGLRVRIYAPSSINQGSSSLCGPASLLFDLAVRDPVAYVQYVISLYETGVGHIEAIKVVPGKDLKAYDPGKEVEASDWIALASLRDSENFFFDYQEASDAFAGITLPGELERWFRKAGYSDVIEDARAIIDQDEENIRRADLCFHRGYRVCLFIHSNMLGKSTQSKGSATADHWVVQTDSVTFGAALIEGEMKRTISLRIYTWGEGKRGVPQTGVLPVDDFLDNYYGFVAARY